MPVPGWVLVLVLFTVCLSESEFPSPPSLSGVQATSPVASRLGVERGPSWSEELGGLLLVLGEVLLLLVLVLAAPWRAPP